MRRCTFHPGDTVLFDLVIPFEIADVSEVVISFRNNNEIGFDTTITSFKAEVVESDDGETIVNRTRIGFTLTQEESCQFKENDIYKMQLNVYGPNSSRAASKEYDVYTLAQHIPEARRNEAKTSDINYNELKNKPKINSVDLVNNRELPETAITSERIEEILSST